MGNTENRCFRPLHCRVMPFSVEPRASIRINLILLGLESLATFMPPIVWVYLSSHFHGWLRNAHTFCNRVRNGRSRSPN